MLHLPYSFILLIFVLLPHIYASSGRECDTGAAYHAPHLVTNQVPELEGSFLAATALFIDQADGCSITNTCTNITISTVSEITFAEGPIILSHWGCSLIECSGCVSFTQDVKSRAELIDIIANRRNKSINGRFEIDLKYQDLFDYVTLMGEIKLDICCTPRQMMSSTNLSSVKGLPTISSMASTKNLKGVVTMTSLGSTQNLESVLTMTSVASTKNVEGVGTTTSVAHTKSMKSETGTRTVTIPSAERQTQTVVQAGITMVDTKILYIARASTGVECKQEVDIHTDINIPHRDIIEEIINEILWHHIDQQTTCNTSCANYTGMITIFEKDKELKINISYSGCSPWHCAADECKTWQLPAPEIGDFLGIKQFDLITCCQQAPHPSPTPTQKPLTTYPPGTRFECKYGFSDHDTETTICDNSCASYTFDAHFTGSLYTFNYSDLSFQNISYYGCSPWDCSGCHTYSHIIHSDEIPVLDNLNMTSVSVGLELCCQIPSMHTLPPLPKTTTTHSKTTQSTSITTGGRISTPPTEKPRLSGAAIAGIVIGVLVALMLVAGLAYYFMKKRPYQHADSFSD